MSDSEDESEFRPVVKLKTGIHMEELLRSGNGVSFEVDVEDVDAMNDWNEYSYFADDELVKNLNLECMNVTKEDGESDEGDDGEHTPFETVASKMTKLLDDGGVMKKVVKPGFGSVVPKNAMVSVHYNGYLEYSDEPFDSTRLRKRAHQFRLGNGVVIAGLDTGVASMKKGEVSQFLVKPHLAFGKMGCMPRIPGDAEILFEVELVDFVDDAAAFDFEHLTEEERKERKFDDFYKAARAHHVAGNTEFQNGNMKRALASYRKSQRILEASSVANDEEEKKQKKLELKLAVNQAVCHTKLKVPERVCIQCNKALAMDPNNAKALFLHGKALVALGDYVRAEHYLRKARAIQPNDKDITAELKRVDAKKAKAMSDDKAMCKKMFGTDNTVAGSASTDKGDVPEKDSFRWIMRQRLTSFMENSGLQSVSFPGDVSLEERDVLEAEARRLGLGFRVTTASHGSKICVSKMKRENQ